MALLSLCGFLLVTWQVTVDGPLAGLDERVGRSLVGRGPERFAELGADLGNMPVALPVLAAAAAYAVRHGRRRAALYAGAAMALVPALVVPLKLLLDRPGPLTDAAGHYPSGHTATAVVAYGAAALLVHRRALVPVAAVLTAATGAGLVLRGYHWPLDVVGALLLFGTGFAGFAGFAARGPRDPAGPPAAEAGRARAGCRRRLPCWRAWNDGKSWSSGSAGGSGWSSCTSGGTARAPTDGSGRVA